MWWGGNLFPAILDFLESEDPHIVALQEVYDGKGPQLEDRYRSVEVLQAHLSYPHYDYAQSFIHNSPVGRIPQGNAILSKLPISARSKRFLVETDREEYEDTPEQWPILPRILQHVKLDSPTGELNVFNIHGVWDLDGYKYSPARQKWVKSFWRKLTAGRTSSWRGTVTPQVAIS